jgi:hypothetical protein
MQQNLFTPENVPALRVIGCVEGRDIFTEWRYPDSRLSLGIDSNGVLLCESMHGFCVTVRINDAINTANIAADNEGRMELRHEFVTVVLSDGTSIVCSGALYPSIPQMTLSGCDRESDWFWLDVCPSYSENAVQIVQ